MVVSCACHDASRSVASVSLGGIYFGFYLSTETQRCEVTETVRGDLFCPSSHLQGHLPSFLQDM